MMPASGSAAKRPLIPPGMKPAPPAVKLPPWNLNSSTMMASTGMATFHHVMTLLTLANRRMARKLTAVKAANREMGKEKTGPGTVPTPAPLGRAMPCHEEGGSRLNDNHSTGGSVTPATYRKKSDPTA